MIEMRWKKVFEWIEGAIPVVIDGELEFYQVLQYKPHGRKYINGQWTDEKWKDVIFDD